MSLPAEAVLEMKKGLPPSEVDRRLVAAARVHRRVESVLCFYLQEVENRRLYLKYGFASTVDYGRASAGMISRESGAPYGVRAVPSFGSRDPESGKARYVRWKSDWKALDPKGPLGSLESEGLAQLRRPS